MKEQYKHRALKLSKNAEKHIRKHYGEFDFKDPKKFTRDDILTCAKTAVVEAERVFLHQHGQDTSVVFLYGEVLLIVDAERFSIKTMFKISNEEYIEQKLQRRFWVELEQKTR